jgi:hypothetical protein
MDNCFPSRYELERNSLSEADLQKLDAKTIMILLVMIERLMQF